MGDVTFRSARSASVNTRAYELYLRGSFEMIQGGPNALEGAVRDAVKEVGGPSLFGLLVIRCRSYRC